MRSPNKIYYVASCLLLSSFAHGATIAGTVKGSGGAPLMGAFVEVQNSKNKITVAVLSHKDGHYRAEDLPAGDYQVRARALGYQDERRNGVSLTASQNASFDFVLQKGVIRWSDLNIYQGLQLFPDGTGKSDLEQRCIGCHGFQSRMAAVRRDLDGWRARVQYMRNTMLIGGLTDEGFENVAAYLNSLFGNNSILPPSPADLPAYKNLEQHFSDEAMNIVYVEYTLPGLGRMPWEVNPGKDGKLWIPYFSNVNMIAQLDPATGGVKEFPLPHQPRVGLHSAWQAPDGTVWFTEQVNNRLGKLDPTTGKVTEYQDDNVNGPIRPAYAVEYVTETFRNGVEKNTVRGDEKGYLWTSGENISRLDPRTGKYTVFKERTYSLALDQHGNAWFTSGNNLLRIDLQTLQETKYTPPSGVGAAEEVGQWPYDTVNPKRDATYRNLPVGRAKPYIGAHRILIDTDGLVWFGDIDVGKLTSFDPKTEKFREYQLPGPKPSPYALGIDKNHNLWYSSQATDVIGRLDPATGKVLEYPYLHRENTLREFYYDAQGRMWYGSPANNTVGYFYVAR